MSKPFDAVTVVGLGLIGGSIAAALRELDDAPVVYGVDTDGQTLALAAARGIVDAAAVPEQAQRDGWFSADVAGLVLLATPVDAAQEWLRRLAELGYTGIVSDVSSTKRAVMRQAESTETPYAFIGGHPMAGSERSGVMAAHGDLLRGAYYVLTPGADTPADAYQRLHALITSLGARVVAVEPASHDEAVAVVSHVPHVAAAALVKLAAERAETSGRDVLRLAAGGFKDMTRIAAGSPDLWTGICLDNADAIGTGIEALRDVLGEFGALLAAGDAAGLRTWLAASAEVRRALPAQWVPATSRLRELTLTMSDRPGVISSVTAAAAHAGCNIEDIAIDHQSEDTAVLRLVLTDEGDVAGLVEALRALGFHAELRALEEEGS